MRYLIVDRTADATYVWSVYRAQGVRHIAPLYRWFPGLTWAEEYRSSKSAHAAAKEYGLRRYQVAPITPQIRRAIREARMEPGTGGEHGTCGGEPTRYQRHAARRRVLRAFGGRAKTIEDLRPRSHGTSETKPKKPVERD